MSNPEQVAFENLQRLAAMFRGIIDIAPDLQKLGSLNGAVAEAQSRLDEIKKQEAILPDQIAQMIAQAKKNAAQIEGDARSAASKLHDDAVKQHGLAVTHANEIVETGYREAAKYVTDIKASVAEHEERVVKAQASLADIEKKRAAAMADIDAGKRDREMVNSYQKQVADAKADLSGIEQRKAAVVLEIEKLSATLANKQAAHDRITDALTDIASKVGLR